MLESLGWRVRIRYMPDLPWDLEVMPLPVQERHDGTKGGVQACQAVAQGDVRPDRRPVQVAIQVPDASVGLAHTGVAGQVRLGACLAIAADPGVDQGVLQILQSNQCSFIKDAPRMAACSPNNHVVQARCACHCAQPDWHAKAGGVVRCWCPELRGMCNTRSKCAGSGRGKVHLWPQAPLLHHARPEVLDQDIRPV